MPVNEDLRSRAVAHSIYLERLKSGAVKRVIALLDAADQDLVALLLKRNAGAGMSAYRLEQLLTAIRTLNAEASVAYREALRAELRETARYEVDFQARTIESALPTAVVADLAIVRPSMETVYSATFSRPFQGRLLKEWASGLERAKYVAVRDAIRLGVVEGETVQQIVTRIRGTKAAKFQDGVLAISRRQAEAVVRTAVNHTVTQAKDQLYQANADLVKGVMWTSTLDSRTTEICMSRDGQVFPVDSGPRPPAHWNCRSVVTPVLVSYRELGIDRDDIPPAERASMNGQVPGTMTYGEWLKTQPVEVQNEALGVTKARLFRSGGLTVDKFVDRKGRAYSVDELRVREAAAFERAGL